MDINLEPPGGVTKIDKVAFAHVAMGSDSSGRTKRLALFEFFSHFRNRARNFEGAPERFDSARTQRFQFLAALRNQFVFRLHSVGMIMVERRSCQVPLLVPLCNDVTF